MNKSWVCVIKIPGTLKMIMISKGLPGYLSSGRMKLNFDLSCPNRIPLRCHQGNMTCRICQSHGIPSPKSRLRPLTKTQREALVKARFSTRNQPIDFNATSRRRKCRSQQGCGTLSTYRLLHTMTSCIPETSGNYPVPNRNKCATRVQK